MSAEEARRESLRSPTLLISELELGARYEKALTEAGVTTAGQVADMLRQGGDEALLAVKGFGHKALIEAKRKLRARGFELSEAEAEAEAHA